jgi:hypothetical protein
MHTREPRCLVLYVLQDRASESHALLDKMVLPRGQHFDLVPYGKNTLVQRRDLHTQARSLAPLVDDPVLPHCSTRFISICYARQRVNVWKLATGGTARDV